MVSYQEFRIIIEDARTIRFIPPNWTDRAGMKEEVAANRMIEKIIDVFSRLLERPFIADGKPFYINRELLEIFGATLFNRIFSENMRAYFWNTWNQLPPDDTRLRVILEFKPAARDLALLPWEFMYLPDRDEGGAGFFLAGGDSRVVLARQVPLFMSAPQADTRPLRLLIAAAQPKNMGALSVDEEIAAVHAELDKLPPGQIAVRALRQPTKEELRAELLAFRPHILHFIGHGQFKNGRGELALIDPHFKDRDASAAPLSDRDLSDFLLAAPPRLVFLNACKGAAADSYAAFRGLALALVDVRVSAVVAMQYAIDNTHAVAFAASFYDALSRGEPIDVAVQHGRQRLGMFGGDNFANRAFGCPVVFMQSSTGLVLPQDAAAPALTPVSADRDPCPVCDTPNRLSAKRCIKCQSVLATCQNPNCSRHGRLIWADGGCEECGYPRVSSMTAAAGVRR